MTCDMKPTTKNIKMALPFTRDDVHILVIDDDIMQLTVVSKSLISLGYKATNANNGKEALDILNSGIHIDLILSDVMMPVMDGPQFLSAARADPRFTEIPIIMMSSNDQYEIVFNCLSRGADDYMIKPLTPQVLKNIYANVWLKRKQQAIAAKVQNQIVSTAALTKQIQQLKTNYNQSFHSPIQDIKTSLENLLQTKTLTPDIQESLTQTINKLKGLDSNANIPMTSSPQQQIPQKMQNYFSSQYGVKMQPSNSSNNTPTVTPVSIPAVRKRVGAPIPAPARPVIDIPQLSSLNLGESLFQLHFNIWNIKESLLINLANDLLNSTDVVKTLNSKPGEIEHFLKRTLQSHNANPFNNFRRSCDCLQFAVYLLRKIGDNFTEIEKTALILSTLLHDIDHPGTNNLFQINTCSKISIIYNNKHPIESNSASLGSKIIQECFSLNLNDNNYIEIRNIFINCVLGTNYSKLQKFLMKISYNDKIDFNNKNHKMLVLKLIVLMADLSFAIRKWDITNYWYQMLKDEQLQQGDMEKRLGMNVEPLMDRRNSTTKYAVLKTYFNIVVLPVFQTGIRIFPELEEELLKALQENLSIIEEIDAMQEKDNDNENK
ncbi:cAMP phosphodiesterase [Histomonas meleagridis]|uniref:cAMP phosphodiesterase n=1 Tax=Histomonas meleagridis TaxID=135588 RepID=UPI0035598917|nr:cAMP phosphodiesterase [Histomonas meleagridis]KAH0803982.1 cAMP phosphodiesterase [Histomonas meleagridis]